MTAGIGFGGWQLLVATALTLVLGAAPLVAQARDGQERVRASHENLEPDSRVDEYGIFVPVPASHPGRRFPADDAFPTGPAVGERLPDFVLPNQRGEAIDFHRDRGDSRAVVMFQRSAVW
ncbi:MAG: hypothetical protein R3190_00545 [Thermoanaerobaculia bacterium]|nr:hypothetical protein [Thermoanaerobaculia bacterium]